MPIYEYRCERCGDAFDMTCSIAEREEKAVCPACGSREVRQVFASIGVKGSGAVLNPGCFERPRRPGATPRWVEPRK